MASGGITELTRNPLDPDKLAMAPRQEVADAAHAALFPLQDLTPHIAVLGVGVLFLTLCRMCRLDAEEVYRKASRVLHDEEGWKRTNDSLQSLRDFARIRMMGEETTVS